MANENQPDEQKPEPQLLVRGKRAGLGALRRELIPTYHRWRSDPEVRRGQGSTDVATIEAVQAWYDQAASSDAPEVYFTVYDLTDLAPVGTTLLVRIDHHRAPPSSASSSASGATKDSAPMPRGSPSIGASPSSAYTTSCSSRSPGTGPPSVPTRMPASARSGGGAAPSSR
jgi:hypothetical protein